MTQLFDRVVQVLSALDPTAGQRFTQTFTPQCEPHRQMYELNRFLRLQLGQLERPTYTERECLMDGISERDWLHNFRKQVAPTIVAEGLPAWKS